MIEKAVTGAGGKVILAKFDVDNPAHGKLVEKLEVCVCGKLERETICGEISSYFVHPVSFSE